ncbi:hypothetical protein H0E87_012288 [Populus deltoides]|uniref:PUB domain-containing protein n=1 Tax=Populus deltoides TaxID=3696 RepID=A0A8T2YIQ4_POPDE|nr:hypothetical protein H0E87_012288 [Populus deltoides]
MELDSINLGNDIEKVEEGPIYLSGWKKAALQEDEPLPCALETQLLKGLHKVENLASEKSFRQTFKSHLGLVINEALLRVGLDDATVKRAFQTLLVYVGNVAKNPDREKFRRIRIGNPLFQLRAYCIIHQLTASNTVRAHPLAHDQELCLSCHIPFEH